MAKLDIEPREARTRNLTGLGEIRDRLQQRLFGRIKIATQLVDPGEPQRHRAQFDCGPVIRHQLLPDFLQQRGGGIRTTRLQFAVRSGNELGAGALLRVRWCAAPERAR